MEATCSVNEHNVSTIGLGTAESVESHRSRITAHLLLDDSHPYPFAPYAELLDCSSTEGVSGTEIHLLARLLELIG